MNLSESLPYSVYREGELMAATAYPEDAAASVSLLGEGGVVRCTATDAVLWTEGRDGIAAESFDVAAEIIESKRVANFEAMAASVKANREAHRAAQKAKAEARRAERRADRAAAGTAGGFGVNVAAEDAARRHNPNLR